MGFHKWVYKSDYKRHCSICAQKEIYIQGSPVSGMADDSYWTKQK